MHEEMRHLDLERISALLDEPGCDDVAARHLEACETCGREHERLRRMRMALSALDDLDPPADEWERIEAELREEEREEGSDAGPRPGAGGSGDGRAGPWSAADGNRSWSARVLRLAPDGATGLRAAAAVLLFLGGTWLGVTLRDGGPPPVAAGSGDRPAELATSDGTSPDAVAPEGAADARQWLAGLESLRARGPSPEEVASDPEGAAEHLARLDALIQASRAYVRDVPSDSEVNDFLFEVVEERNSLNQALRFASLEYR